MSFCSTHLNTTKCIIIVNNMIYDDRLCLRCFKIVISLIFAFSKIVTHGDPPSPTVVFSPPVALPAVAARRAPPSAATRSAAWLRRATPGWFGTAGAGR